MLKRSKLHSPQVLSGRISNPSKTLWLSLLHARMKKIQSKIKALEWSRHYTLIFSRRSRAANSVVQSLILPNFEPILYCMVVLVICKNREEPIKMKEIERSQDFFHYNPMGAICCHGNKSSDPIYPKPNAANPPPQ